jgi:hypothetical protein
MRIKKKYLKSAETKTVRQLDYNQRDLDHMLGKKIEVRLYHEPYAWRFYLHEPTEKVGGRTLKRVVLYPHNFEKKKKAPKSAAAKATDLLKAVINSNSLFNDKLNRRIQKFIYGQTGDKSYSTA